jgi:glycolate oxidase iron-sulfur subunit
VTLGSEVILVGAESTGPDAERLATPQNEPWASIPYERFLDCVHCGLCTVSCPTYLETGNENDGPRGRIDLMRAVVDGRLDVTDRVKRHLDLCLDCRSCETACPSGVQYGRIIEPFREEVRQLETRAGNDPSCNWFSRFILLGLFPFARRLHWAMFPARIMQVLRLDAFFERVGLTKLLPPELQRMQSLLPRLAPTPRRFPDVLPAIGKRRARVALFTGCVADAVFRETHWATARVLQANGCDVIIPQSQVCCGAIHYHNGAAKHAMRFAEQNARSFDIPDVDAVVVNVAGCGAMLKEYPLIGPEVCPGHSDLHERLAVFADKVRDVSEFLFELGLRPPTGPIPIRAAYDDACHLVHVQNVSHQPRALLASVPGLELVPIQESEICCGAAGSYNMTEREMSDRLGQRKLANIVKTKSQAVITGNAGCLLQIQSLVKSSDHRLWVAHPIDVLDLSYRRQSPPFLKGTSEN